jgi:RNA polymerase sigma factor (sigma-70 family)
MTNFVGRTVELFNKMKVNPSSRLLYRNEIVEINLRLVAHVLKKYRPYNDDQYQAGCMGLIVAVDTYKEEKGVPFPNYACFCIEREIHKMHRDGNKLIENILKDSLIYLDEKTTITNGDEMCIGELIADPLADEGFMKVLQDNNLENFFEKVIIDSIETIAGNTKGLNTKIDLTQWKSLEIRYILELAQVESQKARLNLSKMAKILDMSTQNIRNRHERVIDCIKKRCNELGYTVE